VIAEPTLFINLRHAVQRISIVIISLLVAIALFYGPDLVKSVSRDTSTVDTMGGNPSYDSYAEGINTVLFNELGEIDYTLQATQQIHYRDNLIELKNPAIRHYRNGDSRWNIVANSGRIFSNPGQESEINRFDLIGAVEVYLREDSGDLTLLSTEFLELNPSLETLDTSVAVKMVSRSLEQEAIGMHANLDDETILFKSNVRGRYTVEEN
jgi:LPS export ABC transporter protein LptC